MLRIIYGLISLGLASQLYILISLGWLDSVGFCVDFGWISVRLGLDLACFGLDVALSVAFARILA